MWINYEWNMNNLWTKWHKLWIIYERSDWFAIFMRKSLEKIIYDRTKCEQIMNKIEQNMNKIWINYE